MSYLIVELIILAVGVPLPELVYCGGQSHKLCQKLGELLIGLS